MANRLAWLLVLTLPAIAAELRIGVLSLFRPARITIRSSEPLWIRSGSRDFFLDPGQVAGLRAVGQEVDLFAQKQSSTSQTVTIAGRGGAPASFRMQIEGKIDRNFTGRLHVNAVGSTLEPIISVELEAAVAAVVAAEMPRDSPVEALRAMAVLARSYYLASARRHGPYDFCDTTHCQWRRETIQVDHPATQATKSTEGVVITYGGRVLPAMFHASCGGKTRTAEEVGLSREAYPYNPVDCDACRRNRDTWTRKLPADVAQMLLRGPNEAHRLDINRRFGSKSLPSNNYRAYANGADIIFEGKGEGHGLGVCQEGMLAAAREGADYRKLLSHYLPQTRTSGN